MGSMHIFIKKKVVSNPHLAVFVASKKKKIAAVRTFPHLSAKLKALLRTEHRNSLDSL